MNLINENCNANRYVCNPHSEKLEPHEWDFYIHFVNEERQVEIIPKDRTSEATKPTNDFIWEGEEWELKSPTSRKYRTIARHIKDAAKQGKTNFMIYFADGRVKEKLMTQLSDYNKRHTTHKVEKLYILIGSELKRLI